MAAVQAACQLQTGPLSWPIERFLQQNPGSCRDQGSSVVPEPVYLQQTEGPQGGGTGRGSRGTPNFREHRRKTFVLIPSVCSVYPVIAAPRLEPYWTCPRVSWILAICAIALTSPLGGIPVPAQSSLSARLAQFKLRPNSLPSLRSLQTATAQGPLRDRQLPVTLHFLRHPGSRLLGSWGHHFEIPLVTFTSNS